MNIDAAKIRKTMRSLRENHIDKLTGELNYTGLAEETAQVLDLYEDDEGTIPEEIFDIATEFTDTEL